ncbi:MAG: hypothetical protein K6A95_09300 [Bacteroidales bacterium]|nr:hypothetical protein [Bacteroidales bacterium]
MPQTKPVEAAVQVAESTLSGKTCPAAVIQRSTIAVISPNKRNRFTTFMC